MNYNLCQNLETQKLLKHGLYTKVMKHKLANATQQVLIKTCANKFCSAKCYIVKVLIHKL